MSAGNLRWVPASTRPTHSQRTRMNGPPGGGWCGLLLLLQHLRVELLRLPTRNAQRLPLPRPQVLSQKHDLPNMKSVMRERAVQSLQHGMRLAADRSPSVPGLPRTTHPPWQKLYSSLPPTSLMISARVVSGFISNSRSRKRSAFSPSVVRKSVKREPMFPAMCFTITATEFDSASNVANSSSSLS